MKTSLFYIFLAALLLSACTGNSTPTEKPFATPIEATSKIALTSTAISDGQLIPIEYTCDGHNTTPPLAWGEPPAGTQSFALTFDDPDAPSGTFVHWIIFNIPAGSRGLPQGLPNDKELPDGSLQGRNGTGDAGYIGPCPPSGTHRYFFRLYALDTKLNLAYDTVKQDLLDAMQGHVLGHGELMATFHK
jgi:Raf kinase inhibitor-like YbhB/YbcL family protein